jgi:hypothetical protein
MADGDNDYSAFVEEFTSIEHQGYDVLDPCTGEMRHFVVEHGLYFETGQLDVGVARFRLPWWRRLPWWWRRRLARARRG